MYVSNKTILDIAYVVTRLSKYTINPNQEYQISFPLRVFLYSWKTSGPLDYDIRDPII